MSQFFVELELSTDGCVALLVVCCGNVVLRLAGERICGVLVDEKKKKKKKRVVHSYGNLHTAPAVVLQVCTCAPCVSYPCAVRCLPVCEQALEERHFLLLA